MKQPTKPDQYEILEHGLIGDHLFQAFYDHATDNYEFKVNESVVWCSDGRNEHWLAEMIGEAICDSLRAAMKRPVSS